MNFFCINWLQIDSQIEKLHDVCENAAMASNRTCLLSESERTKISSIIQEATQESNRMGLTQLEGEFSQMFGLLLRPDGCSHEVLAAELGRVHRAIHSQFMKLDCVLIPLNKSKYFQNDNLFDNGVVFPSIAFPSAKAEIRDAGNCLALDLHTAAVFHLMRATNIGARALARSLGIIEIRSKELDYCRDETLFEAVQEKIKSVNVSGTTRDGAWERENGYYRGLLVDLRYFKDEYRDPVAHARKSYTENGALNVFDQVRNFMQRLATRISE